MSGTVLGKSCLVLGVEFGMWNAKAAPGAVPWARDGARDGHSENSAPRWNKSRGGRAPQQPSPKTAQISQKPRSHNSSAPWDGHSPTRAPSSWNCCQSTPRAEPGPGAALPSPPQGHHGPPGSPGTPRAWEALLEHSASLGGGSKAGAPLCPSGWPALTSLLTGTGVFQNTDTWQGEVSTLTQGFVGKGRIWKLFTPRWVIQTWLAQALVDLPQWKHCSDSKDLFRKWH